jgi:hypothetical protein
MMQKDPAYAIATYLPPHSVVALGQWANNRNRRRYAVRAARFLSQKCADPENRFSSELILQSLLTAGR